MSEGSAGVLALVAMIWIGWPLYQISDHLGALRKIAEGKSRGQ